MLEQVALTVVAPPATLETAISRAILVAANNEGVKTPDRIRDSFPNALIVILSLPHAVFVLARVSCRCRHPVL
jgi:hypothetical protein